VEEVPMVGDAPAIPRAHATPVQFVLLDDTDDDEPVVPAEKEELMVPAEDGPAEEEYRTEEV
jgi:hypothetical protein